VPCGYNDGWLNRQPGPPNYSFGLPFDSNRIGMVRVPDQLERVPGAIWGVVATLLLLLVFVIDVISGPELAFGLFYIFPIAIVAWFIAESLGSAVAIISSMLWYLAEQYSGVVYSNPLFAYWNAGIRLGYFLLAVLLMRVARQLDRERSAARTDYLTGAVNTRFFRALSQREIDRASRYGYPMTIAYVDVDDFKGVNDAYGHAVGDRVLKAIADGMQKAVRKTDVVARIGGDEFALLFPEMGAVEAQGVVSKLQSILTDEMRRHSWPVTFSIGVLTFESAPSSSDEMLNLADRMMYAVKKAGKDNVRFSTKERIAV
jgi:diguanylate cyclase (GGDEF)-like protein